MLTSVRRPPVPKKNIEPLLAERWSPRAIDPQQSISEAEISQLLEAASWAPSAFNNQSWHYLVLNEAAALEKGRAALVPLNQAWANKAPLLLFAVSQKNFRNKNQPNRLADYELGMASIYMALQATSMNLVFHQMAGFSPDVVHENFAIDRENYRVLVGIALGKPGEISELPQEKIASETAVRERISFKEFCHFNSWD